MFEKTLKAGRTIILMEYIVKSHDITEIDRYPGARPVEQLLRNGIIILDKWPGPTCNDVSATVKKLLKREKTGHAGTLDPAVSGVLPITLDNACKVVPALQNLDKEYVGIMRMHKDVDFVDVQKTAKQFIGTITQRPPLRSAVARKERERKISSLNILEVDGRDVLFRISCQAGTYVRVVCHDIGKKLGGANMTELRRIRSGRFDESKAVRLQDVVDAYEDWKSSGDEKIRDYVLPIEAAIEHLPKIIIKNSAVRSVANGSPVYTPAVSIISREINVGDLTAILTLNGELVALAKSNTTSDIKGKGIAAKTDRVIIDKNAYT